MTDQQNNLTKEDVVSICNTIKLERIEVNDDPIERPKNVEFMAKYELDQDDIRNIVRKLSVNDYISGPDYDYNPKFPIPFWKFVTTVNGINVDVYLKIKVINHCNKIIVFSVHEEGVYD